MKKLIVIGLVATLACLSVAQGGGGQGRRGGMMRFGGGGAGIGLAMRSDVSKELALTAEQKVKLESARDEMRPQRINGGPNGGPGGGGGGFNMDEMRKRMEERRTKEKKLLESVLSAEQLKRLKELGIQRSGNMALLDADVQKDLKFTDGQKKQVDSLMQKSQEASQAIMEKIRNQEMDFESARPVFEKNRKIMDDELLKILSSEQKKQFADMGGKAFKFDPDEDRGGFGG